MSPPSAQRRGRASSGTRSPVGVSPRLSSKTLSGADSSPGQASWDVACAGVTRARLSQSSGSTPRTGRSAGEHDARSRPSAGLRAPPAGTAPAPLQGPSREASLDERDWASV